MGKKNDKHHEKERNAEKADQKEVETELLKTLKEQQPLEKKFYEDELEKLQTELVKLQGWVKATGEKIVLIFEGRDAAGKGGIIKRITEMMNPRSVSVIALPVPTEREKTQWYYQRYVAHLPAAGEIAIFDRSWYNRAGVERVMGFATEDQVQKFFKSTPVFERLIIDSGIRLIKYWVSVSNKEQEERFQDRLDDITTRWKFSPIDLAARTKWDEYSKAQDDMFRYTDLPHAPWYVIPGDDKKRARLNCIHHLLSLIPYKDVPQDKVILPEQNAKGGYLPLDPSEINVVPQVY